ncbi:hypothetical protein HMPREF1321_0403 [Capnocytophaga sp. oral taxon 412 str. F0487]|uniref:hypothetical protein n=1 Tax=Capnocytophaga sp. oral taxon 412 TaxID=712218 RepID=UPI0002697597|nr:hypothetical protein [Capnocytophaga sp. oral taxon 412]EIW94093.1 hypothetical protein HMPREF1321_0403 [Capnocytophaga sp. oral taxon 412 str. F0487]
MSNYYKPSGKFSPISFVYFILVCTIVLPILATIYAYLIWYIPIIYLNFLVTFGFGFAIAFTVGYLVVRLGKVRNYGLAILFALIASLVAYYLQWVVWADLAINTSEVYGNKQIGVAVSNVQIEQLLYLLGHPSDLFGLIGLINEEGTWAIKGNTVSGVFLTIIWVIEFLVIVIMGIVASVGRAKEPFNELADEWFKEEELPAFSYIENVSDFKQQAEQGNWEQLFTVIQRGDKGTNHSVFTLYTSANEYYLSVSNATAKKNKKDKIEFDTEDFIKYLSIDKTVYDLLKSKI